MKSPLAIGHRVKILAPIKGHDPMDPKKVWTITERIYDKQAIAYTYKLEGNPSIWPHSRLIKA